MDMVELGRRIKIARIQVLKMSQVEFAKTLNSYQGVVSRLEKGIGGSLELVLEIITLLEKRGFNGSMLFSKTYTTQKLKEKTQPNHIPEKIFALKETIGKGYEQVTEIQALLKILPETK